MQNDEKLATHTIFGPRLCLELKLCTRLFYALVRYDKYYFLCTNNKKHDFNFPFFFLSFCYLNWHQFILVILVDINLFSDSFQLFKPRQESLFFFSKDWENFLLNFHIEYYFITISFSASKNSTKSSFLWLHASLLPWFFIFSHKFLW